MKAAAAKPAPVISIQGKHELVAGQKQTVDAGEVADGLVYFFLPKTGNPKPNPGYFTIRTHSKGFTPSLVVLPAGSTIASPNRDTVLHNVFSRTPGAIFDLGNYGPGQSRQQVFTKPGLITVNCSVHYTMRAMAVVMATPYYTRPDKNGRFELTGLPSGAGPLVAASTLPAAESAKLTTALRATDGKTDGRFEIDIGGVSHRASLAPLFGDTEAHLLAVIPNDSGSAVFSASWLPFLIGIGLALLLLAITLAMLWFRVLAPADALARMVEYTAESGDFLVKASLKGSRAIVRIGEAFNRACERVVSSRKP